MNDPALKSGFKGKFDDEQNHELIHLIVLTLSKVWGHPAYISLLSSILSISSTQHGKYGVDFLLHSPFKQANLFISRGIKPLRYRALAGLSLNFEFIGMICNRYWKDL